MKLKQKNLFRFHFDVRTVKIVSMCMTTL